MRWRAVIAAAALAAVGVPVAGGSASAVGACANPSGTYTGAVPWGSGWWTRNACGP
ncbi:hypothetical protein [Amycolatopsis sp. FDAARGOS 1241]|uniref:hypothetical protein n=1 Tax=Amycolatopsis sp. FDAARGOS 1241 TaxID=2778070 RepID=UPI001EF3D031|nr:hypothetical protein [Amycolatopsis sp. FDAARGOS 1241]